MVKIICAIQIVDSIEFAWKSVIVYLDFKCMVILTPAMLPSHLSSALKLASDSGEAPTIKVNIEVSLSFITTTSKQRLLVA